MIYEHITPEGRFFIEWNAWRSWGANQEAKWVGTHKGAVLAQGPDPETVLDALLGATADPAVSGAVPSEVRLPQTLGGWRASLG